MIWRKFLWIIRNWYVCYIYNNLSKEHPNYYPFLKVKEFQKNLDHHFNSLFVPGNCLRPGESLFCAFGWVKFNPTIIKQWHGMVSTFMLWQICRIITFKIPLFTQGRMCSTVQPKIMKLKMIQVVKCLCEPSAGTYGTIYIDMLYTSIDILIELNDIFIFDVGTCMENITPKWMVVGKRSLDYN